MKYVCDKADDECRRGYVCHHANPHDWLPTSCPIRCPNGRNPVKCNAVTFLTLVPNPIPTRL